MNVVWSKCTFPVFQHFHSLLFVIIVSNITDVLQLCREYKSVVTFNARLGKGEGAKSVVCQELMDYIMSLDVFHDAQLDIRGMSDSCDRNTYMLVYKMSLLY